MKTIIVDDENLMIRKFVRLSAGIPDIDIAGQFTNAKDAIEFAENNNVDIAFLDIDMPVMNGIELARKLREIRKDMIIVFISAYDEYVRDFNDIGGDYYLIKPYDRQVLEMTMEKVRLIAARQQKKVYVRMFGNFQIMKNDSPVPLTGKAKEIMAFIMTKRGHEVSNEELYSVIWENRPYSNENMAVYYNALRRLKKALAEYGVSDLLISNKHGQMANVALFDCDYYAWQDGNMSGRDRFNGEFLSEYSWGEYILGDIVES